MSRKIVQIAAVGQVDAVDEVYAVADDGTVWRRVWGMDGTQEWERLPPIPQESEGENG